MQMKCILRPMWKMVFLMALLVFSGNMLLAQSTCYPTDPDLYHWIDRAEIRTMGQNGNFHSAVRPLTRQSVSLLMDSLSKFSTLSRIDRYHIQYFREVSPEFSIVDSSGLRKPLFGTFFHRKADILSHHDSVFDLHANIAGYGALGKSNDAAGSYLINSRGVEVRGTIAGRVGFYSFMTENQIIVPEYVSSWVSQFGSLPHEGFWKRTGPNGYDFFTARAYITFNAGRHIAFQAGHDRFQIGHGYRSLILSDFGNPFTFLRINTSVWKLEYTNLFASLKGDINSGVNGIPGSRRIPGKMFAFHRLGINFGKRFSLGIFEAVVGGQDPALQSAGSYPDPSYFNPIIFYRAIEQNSGSPDNAGLGLDARFAVNSSIRVYSQFFLDEFLLAKMKAGNGWWGNKFGFQGGLHYINFAGISNLDVQGEFNLVRPFTYSHLSNYSSYAHYGQPLAHPLGANFREVLGIIRYQVLPSLTFTGKAIYFERGLDLDDKSYGSNVLKSYTLRIREDGNFIGQGLLQKVLLADITLTWQCWTNFFLDFKQVFRKEGRSIGQASGNMSLTSLAVRWNMAQRLHEF
jgi:hypothetical protein